jgi:hypothetical protein
MALLRLRNPGEIAGLDDGDPRILLAGWCRTSVNTLKYCFNECLQLSLADARGIGDLP